MRARGDEGRRGDGASRDQGAEGKREERQLDSTQRDFLAMLAALAPLPDPKWKHVRERVRADPRYDAVRSREREELFEMHLASARQALASHVAPLSLSPPSTRLDKGALIALFAKRCGGSRGGGPRRLRRPVQRASCRRRPRRRTRPPRLPRRPPPLSPY